jgi:hypothetical protein
MTVDDLEFLFFFLFFSFLFSFLTLRMNRWVDVDEIRGSKAQTSRYVATMGVIRVRVGVMEFCCFSLRSQMTRDIL